MINNYSWWPFNWSFLFRFKESVVKFLVFFVSLLLNWVGPLLILHVEASKSRGGSKIFLVANFHILSNETKIVICCENKRIFSLKWVFDDLTWWGLINNHSTGYFWPCSSHLSWVLWRCHKRVVLVQNKVLNRNIVCANSFQPFTWRSFGI